MKEAEKEVEKAVTDSSQENHLTETINAFEWAKVESDALELQPQKEEQLLQESTIQQGMHQTEGYIGTDLDP